MQNNVQECNRYIFMGDVIDLDRPLTPKQEEACQAFVCHPDNAVRGNKSAAYREAYITEGMKPETIWDEACKLFSRPHVAQRVQELREQRFAENPVTIETLLEEYEEGQRLARSCEQAGAHVAATTAKAKLLGLLVEKQQVDQTIVDHREHKPAQFTNALDKARKLGT